MSTADPLQIDRHLLEEYLAFLRELKDKKLTSDQKERKNKMVIALDDVLKAHQQGAAANGVSGEDGAEEGELYLPMDEQSLQEKQKESAATNADPPQENYEPMSEGRLEKPVTTAALEGPDDEYMNPDGDHAPEEVEQEEYEDVESALESSRGFLTSGNADSTRARSPAISPSPSSDNISEKSRKKNDKRSNLPFGKSKKRTSETSDAVPMPDPSTAQLSGNLEYRAGRVGRFTKHWVVLEGGCLFIGKSEEDKEAIRLMNLTEYSLDRSKGHFDLKKGRDKVTFKAESSEQLSKWIAQLQSTLLEAKGEGDQVSVQGTEASDGPEDVNEEDLVAEEMYDDVEGASSSQLNVPSIEVSASPSNNLPSHRPPSSPLPDLPPDDEEESQTVTAKAKTLLKGFKLKRSKRSTSPMPREYIKGGYIYMYKKGTFGGGTWEKRYCCVTGEGKLCYSATDDDADRKGVIELRPHAQKIKTKDAHNDKKVEAHPYLMLIAKSTLAFTSAEERKSWQTEIEYSVSEGLELDSEDEDQSAGYDLSTGMMDEDYDDDDIYEAFDEVAPSLPPALPSSQRPDLPPPRSMLAAAAGIEEELYEDTDEAASQFASSQAPAPGPALPPRGSLPSGPALPPRGSVPSGPALPPRGSVPSGPALPPRGSVASGPALPQRNPGPPPASGPPLPPRPSDQGQPQDVAEEIYDDTLPEEAPEIYDDVESAASVPVQKEPPKPELSPKLGKGSPKAGKKSPKQAKGSSKPGKKWSPFSRSKKPHASAPAADAPEEVYDDVEAEQPPSKPTADPSPLVKKTTSPPTDIVEEVYDDVEGTTATGGDDLYLPMELEIKPEAKKPEMKKPETEKLETKKPESPSLARRVERSSSPVVPAARSGSFNASGPKTRMGSGKVADMMKKFQQDGGNDEIKCKGRLDHMPPGKNAFQKSWCQLEGSTVAFYRTSRDTETTGKVDARECELSVCSDDFNAKFCLQLSVGSVSHKLNCDSKREFDKWMAALEEVAKKSS